MPNPPALSLWAELLRRQLHQGARRLIEIRACIPSTQDRARELIAQHGTRADGAVIVADEQSQGRGRLGRRWYAPPGTCLLLSRVQMMTSSPGDWLERMSLGAAVAVAQALEEVTQPHPIRVSLKWPNDLWVNDAKLAGLLLETMKVNDQTTAVILGVGINVALSQQQLQGELALMKRSVTSLALLGHDLPRLTVLYAVLHQLDAMTSQMQKDHDPAWTQTLLDAWRSRCAMLGQRVSVKCDGRIHRGTLIDLDPLHGLMLRTDLGALVHLPASTSTVLCG